MNVFIDSTGAMHFGDERETARNCPHCHAFSRMLPTALPSFDELLLQKPRSVGLVLRCQVVYDPARVLVFEVVADEPALAVIVVAASEEADRDL